MPLLFVLALNSAGTVTAQHCVPNGAFTWKVTVVSDTPAS